MGTIASYDAATAIPRGSRVMAVGVYRGVRGLRPAARGQEVRRLDLAYLETRGFSAKPGETQALSMGGGRALLAFGLGSPGELDAEALRKSGAAIVRDARAARVALLTAGIRAEGLSARQVAEHLAIGGILASYEFRDYKSPRSETDAKARIEGVTLIGSPLRPLEEAVGRATDIASAVTFARDLVNEPAGSLPPEVLAERAVERAVAGGIAVDVWDEDRIADERLGGLLGVSAGSIHPPRLLRLSYKGAGRERSTGYVALVGKGVTFDSGGLSLKTAGGMETMKTDMSGAAAVVAAMSVLAALGVAVPVAGYVPLVENMPGGRAIKPGDVLRARNGTSIEVLNTDAEGRLILADALSLAAEKKPAAIVDLATLTGACTIALGDRIAGLMGTDDRLLGRVQAASARSGEAVWHLPLAGEYRKHIDSDVADVKNVGASGGLAGTLTAGLFLKEFAGQGPWAHLDIAGPARSSSDEGYLRRGGTGFGVRLLLDLLEGWRGGSART